MTPLPADIRNMTFDERRAQLTGARVQVWEWLYAHGPATTTEISEGVGISLLTVRPRVTELYQLGFIECIGRKGREGEYRALNMVTAADRQSAATQLPLPLQ